MMGLPGTGTLSPLGLQAARAWRGRVFDDHRGRATGPDGVFSGTPSPPEGGLQLSHPLQGAWPVSRPTESGSPGRTPRGAALWTVFINQKPTLQSSPDSSSFQERILWEVSRTQTSSHHCFPAQGALCLWRPCSPDGPPQGWGSELVWVATQCLWGDACGPVWEGIPSGFERPEPTCPTSVHTQLTGAPDLRPLKGQPRGTGRWGSFVPWRNHPELIPSGQATFPQPLPRHEKGEELGQQKVGAPIPM